MSEARDGGFGVYVHWPFCAQKCPYCDFNSHVRHGGWDEARYRAAYLRELKAAAELSGLERRVERTALRGVPPPLAPPREGEGDSLDSLALAALPPHRPSATSPSRGEEKGRTGGGSGDGEGDGDGAYGPAAHSGALRGDVGLTSRLVEAEEKGRIGRRAVDSIFFGGGTPSLMQPETVAAIIEGVREAFGLADGCEITLEANPGSVDAGRFRGYRDAGVNRVSLGVQALDDAALRRLGRVHSLAEAMAALEIAKATFERVSFDLIYARPGMTEAAWRAELGQALALQVGHLSLYQLTIEDGTSFAELHRAGKLIVPQPEIADRLYAVTQEMCEAAGLPAYEISNHARPGEESRHNLVYWRYGTYLGLGPGAHGRELRAAGRIATVNERGPEAWLARVEERGRGLVEETGLARGEQADEMLLMGLRLVEGVDLERLAAVGGVRPSAKALARLEGLGMVERIGNRRIRATARGRFVLNEVVRQLAVSFEAV